jgi:hypothetical protein
MLGYPSADYQSPRHHAQVCEHARKWSETPYIVDGVLVYVDDLFATADLTALLDPPGANATQHYGPYTNNTSPDSGTCGNDWATDTFDRHFTVRRNPDGT